MIRGGESYATTTKERADWRDDGECARKLADGTPVYDVELWFPIGETGSAVVQIEAAKAVCATCEVFDTCREWSLDHREAGGIWAGMTEGERDKELRRLKRVRHAGRQPGQRNGPMGGEY